MHLWAFYRIVCVGMAKKRQKNLADYIEPLDMNGLRGRVMNLPGKKKKNQQILLIYGHHASIERMFGLAEELNRYGAVTLPDLPGFGGMQSFYRINEKPDLDKMADYLASFIKMRYKNRRVTIVGMSFGFLVIARMLQRYPDIAKKVDELISIVGFVHHEDFKMKTGMKRSMSLLCSALSGRSSSIIARYVCLNRPMIYAGYRLAGDRNVKMRKISAAERSKRIKFEVKLWHCNDVRTYFVTGNEMLRADLCNNGKRIDLPVTHVKVEDDRYFDNGVVEQHLGVVFNDVTVLTTRLKGHAPTVVGTAKDAAPFVPKKLRTILKAA